jgi:hypothetical protein
VCSDVVPSWSHLDTDALTDAASEPILVPPTFGIATLRTEIANVVAAAAAHADPREGHRIINTSRHKWHPDRQDPSDAAIDHRCFGSSLVALDIRYRRHWPGRGPHRAHEHSQTCTCGTSKPDDSGVLGQRLQSALQVLLGKLRNTGSSTFCSNQDSTPNRTIVSPRGRPSQRHAPRKEGGSEGVGPRGRRVEIKAVSRGSTVVRGADARRPTGVVR